ncbi:hypothetical protein HK096_001890 [Nowakowskiella sp. JEL0078]|nr:hypothetical protein HK096_001890 [Nowakowskiella sp. JEL0078]
MSYEQYRAILMPTKQNETPLKRGVAGSLAGVTSVFFSYPFDILRVRLALELRQVETVSLSRTAQIIYIEPSPFFNSKNVPEMLEPLIGLSNFYRGFLPSIYGIIPYAGMSFLTYESFKDLSLHRSFRKYTLVNHLTFSDDNKELPQMRTWVKLVCGGLSGAIAQTSSYPFEMIRRQMQVAGVYGSADAERTQALKSTWGTAKHIYQTRGFKGFFKGLSIGYIKIIPMFAVSFYTYENLKDLFGMSHVGMGRISLG